MEKMDGKTMDIVAENVGKLKELFPEAFTEGKVDFDVLKEVLGTFVDDRDERYRFTWNGKSKARMIAQTPSTGTLRPCKEESVDWDSTQNIFIEGDNLEVLKLLQKSYHKKVKMIYIDPPYNTGKDFVYKDNFKDNIKNYKAITGQIDGEGRNLSSNPETSGRYHTDWLNMMYPRLKLARNLLKDDGVIFISIDDNEVANLRKMCDEIFGEENFVANIVWQKKYGAANDAQYLSDLHDHILLYGKNKRSWRPNLFPRPKELNDKYTNPDNDPRGVWYSTNLSVKTYSSKNDYIITSPAGLEFSPPPSRCWVVSEEKYEELLADNRIWFGKDGTSRPYLKKFLSEVQDGVVPTTIWTHHDAGHNIGGKSEVRDLFKDTTGLFDTPKPTKLISRIIQMSCSKDSTGDLILDFFSGSSSTAHSVMKFNQENEKSYRFIMVQIPEPTDEKSEAYKAGYKTIAEISKERIRRAAAKIKEENQPQINTDGHGSEDELFRSEEKNLCKSVSISGSKKLDLGFKVFKLDSTNIKPWEVDFDLNEQGLFDYVENIKPDRREEDILYEILLKYGLTLDLPIEKWRVESSELRMVNSELENKEKTLNSQFPTLYSIGFCALVVCLNDNITLETVEAITKLKEQQKPEVMRVVFKDSGFKDDVVKTNAVQILKQAGIIDVRSL